MKFPRFNRHLHPQGGRWFSDEDGVIHRADSWPALAVKVSNYRKRAGKLVGDPRAEIEAQVCARHPDYCQEQRPAPPVPSAGPRRENFGQLTARVMRWFAEMLRQRRAGKARKVSAEEAKRRAAICLVCPKQRELSSVCGACKVTRKTAGTVLLGTEKRVNSRLAGCGVLGEDTSVSVGVEQTPVSNPELPENCWRK